MIIDLILIASGGFLGAILRYIVSKKLNHTSSFMYVGTFLINILGSFVLGFIVNIHLHTSVNLMIGIGFLGSFTTFSTFILESITLFESKQNMQFLIYLVLTYTVGILFAFFGFWFAKSL